MTEIGLLPFTTDKQTVLLAALLQGFAAGFLPVATLNVSGWAAAGSGATGCARAKP